MDLCWRPALVLGILLGTTISGMSGGSGLNVVVVVNQNSSNSIALGNYYCEMRQVPPQNLFRMSNWNGGFIDWTLQEFGAALANPLAAFLKERRLTNQIDYVVLSMDIPYRVTDSGSINSTTSALFYGFKTNAPAPGPDLPASCSKPAGSLNAFAGSETPYRSIEPGSASHTNLMTTMITASNLNLAKFTVYQGTISDGSRPTQTAWLTKSSDSARNIRYRTFDRAIFDARVRGDYSLARTNANSPAGLGPLLGVQSGFYSYNAFNLPFVPGALADNLTSYGGWIFQSSGGHLNILNLLAAGATGTYGTVDEPCAYLEKFPTAQNYFYQARGFTLGESYYQSLTNPYQGLLLGDPLAAPFASPSSLQWIGLNDGQTLNGSAEFSLQALSVSPERPVSRLDLFTNGVWMKTLTSIPPTAGNQLTATIDGDPVTYIVPVGASIASVVNGFTLSLNSLTVLTKVKAIAHGDRIELRLTDRSLKGGSVSLTTQSAAGSGAGLTTHLHASRATFLDSVAEGIRLFEVSGNPTNRWLQLAVTRTNGLATTIRVTNTTDMDLPSFVQSLLDAINAHPDLSGPDGVAFEDLVGGGSEVSFNLRARSAGWDAAQIQANFDTQGGLTVTPSSLARLDENLDDLQPRNHLYVSAGLPSLALNFTLNTSELGDGFHQLTATAVEGTHVQTQARTSVNVLVQNGSNEASLIPGFGGTNTAVEATLRFAVTANNPAVNRIELFSSGGSLGVVNGGPSAEFEVSGSFLGLGLHPFYAVASSPAGPVFRTETKWVRLVGPDAPFKLTASLPGPQVSWPATAGRTYTVWSAATLSGPFGAGVQVTPTNEMGVWTDANPTSQTRFYRVTSE